MKKAIAQKWVEALRSGKYMQGQQFLSKDGKYCCLGVLCELAAKEKVCKVYKNNGHKGYDEAGLQKDSRGDEVLPDSVKNWAGMKSKEGIVEGEIRGLYFLNDFGLNYTYPGSDSLTFEDIANIIEDNYKDL